MFFLRVDSFKWRSMRLLICLERSLISSKNSLVNGFLSAPTTDLEMVGELTAVL